MYAHAEPFAPLFDTLLPPNEAKNIGGIQIRSRKPLLQTVLPSNGENMLSMAKAHERLSLLAQLELPCTVLIVDPPLCLRNTVIKNVILGVGNLAILGEEFKLHLKCPNFHTIRLVNRKEEDGTASLNFYDLHGMLYASIQPATDGLGLAVWRDVMDNPSLSLV